MGKKYLCICLFFLLLVQQTSAQDTTFTDFIADTKTTYLFFYNYAIYNPSQPEMQYQTLPFAIKGQVSPDLEANQTRMIVLPGDYFEFNLLSKGLSFSHQQPYEGYHVFNANTSSWIFINMLYPFLLISPTMEIDCKILILNGTIQTVIGELQNIDTSNYLQNTVGTVNLAQYNTTQASDSIGLYYQTYVYNHTYAYTDTFIAWYSTKDLVLLKYEHDRAMANGLMINASLAQNPISTHVKGPIPTSVVFITLLFLLPLKAKKRRKPKIGQF